MPQQPALFYLKDTGIFPNSTLPAVLYHQALDLPYLFKGLFVKQLFAKNHWTNAWDSGIFTYHHYHSTSHEVLGFFKGGTTLLLGGENGQPITVGPGDVLVIPAGVAHKNLGREHQVGCIGAYPDGRDFDINTGKPGERLTTDQNIAQLPVPDNDPVYGAGKGIPLLWIR
ncbi:MAG TPA: cupin [Puia sp.]|nr:cupin [Puia sp.]